MCCWWKYGRAYKALSAGKGAPLHAHRKEYRVQREDDIRIGRNEAQRNTGKRVDNRRCPAHINAEKVRQEHRHHRACDVQHERTQMKQHCDRIAAQRIERKLQQVHGLRTGKYSAAAQYRIRAENPPTEANVRCLYRSAFSFTNNIIARFQSKLFQTNRSKYSTIKYFCKDFYCPENELMINCIG